MRIKIGKKLKDRIIFGGKYYFPYYRRRPYDTRYGVSFNVELEHIINETGLIIECNKPDSSPSLKNDEKLNVLNSLRLRKEDCEKLLNCEEFVSKKMEITPAPFDFISMFLNSKKFDEALLTKKVKNVSESLGKMSLN